MRTLVHTVKTLNYQLSTTLMLVGLLVTPLGSVESSDSLGRGHDGDQHLGSPGIEERAGGTR